LSLPPIILKRYAICLTDLGCVQMYLKGART
jgi:hypothetical protein